MSKRVIIAGSRKNGFSRKDIYDTLDHYLGNQDIIVVSGGARGVDSIGEDWALHRNKPYEVYNADWELYGRSAGYRRNVDMADISDECYVFISGDSRGSQHMVDIAEKKGLPTFAFRS